jgi:hypothetical protein
MSEAEITNTHLPLVIQLDTALKFAEHLLDRFDADEKTLGGPTYHELIARNLITPITNASLACGEIRNSLHETSSKTSRALSLLDGNF